MCLKKFKFWAAFFASELPRSGHYFVEKSETQAIQESPNEVLPLESLLNHFFRLSYLWDVRDARCHST